MKNKIKVRFNLGRGKNYLKWKLEWPDKSVLYLDPEEQQLLLHGCVLKNYKKTAEKIYEGSNKTVCAWVLCDKIDIGQKFNIDPKNQVKYNPRIKPYWTINNIDSDNQYIDTIISKGRQLYVV